MKTAFKISWRALLLILLLVNYISVGILTFISHNHEPDFDFHENCPACKWQVQSQQNDTSTSTVLDALIDPLVFIDHTPTIQSIVLTKQNFQTTNLSRAPPQIA